MLPYLVIIILLCLCAGVGTIWVGYKPYEENYSKTTKKRVVRLTTFYGIAAFVFLLIFFILK
jgi:TRAP-type C4-dicarboxylate transport system permease small subunit